MTTPGRSAAPASATAGRPTQSAPAVGPAATVAAAAQPGAPARSDWLTRHGWQHVLDRFRPGRAVLGLPSWAGRAVAWALAVADLTLLSRTPAASVGFFAVFPMLWVVHETRRGGVLATLVFAAGIWGVLTLSVNPVSGLTNAVVFAGFSLVMGLWMWHVNESRNRVGQLLTEREEALASLARTQAELAATERAAGVSAERERWAHDVHDTLAQGFVSVLTLTQAARAEVERVASRPGVADHPGSEAALDISAVRAHLARVEAVARDNLAEARALVAGEGPTALGRSDLAGALQRLADDQETHGAQRPALSLDLPPGLSPDTEVLVLRTVQEALSNVRRHAHATRVGVDVHTEPSVALVPTGPPTEPGSAVARELVVTVLDDGVGTGGAPEGTGLTGMRARVEAAGGTLTVDPAGPPGEDGRPGTLLEERMPL